MEPNQEVSVTYPFSILNNGGKETVASVTNHVDLFKMEGYEAMYKHKYNSAPKNSHAQRARFL